MAKQIPQNEPEKVTLPRLFGIAPRHYLLWIAAALLLFVLFALTTLPGLQNYGALLHLDSSPQGAAVYLGEKRLGHTPCEVFVPAGEQIIEFRKPDFETARINAVVPGQLFFSAFFPARKSVGARLVLADASALVEHALTRLAEWSLTGQSVETYPVPAVIQPAALDLAVSGKLDEAWGLVEAALPFADTAERHTDLLAAMASLTLGTGTGPLSPRALVAAVGFALARGPEQAAFFLPALETRRSALLRDAAIPAGSAASIASSPAVLFAGGLILLGKASPGVTPENLFVGSFYLSKTEVSVAEYARFLAANPEWRPENRAALIAKGLVDEHYLEHWPANAAGSRMPVREVSAFAAAAYCEWLTRSTPGLTVRLPSETMWEYAARSGALSAQAAALRDCPPVDSQTADKNGIRGMFGGVWEWCSDAWTPAPHLAMHNAMGDIGPLPLPAVEQSVRGGSWLNSGVGPSDRASQPPQWCSPVTGFRIAAVRGR